METRKREGGEREERETDRERSKDTPQVVIEGKQLFCSFHLAASSPLPAAATTGDWPYVVVQ